LYFLIFLQIVTVHLFSKHEIKDLKIIKNGKPQIIKNGNYSLPDNSKITINNKVTRFFTGEIIVEKKKNKYLIFQRLELNDYVFGVLSSELDEMIPIEALKAFYLVVKNYSITNFKRHKKLRADFCDIAHCQLYYGNSGFKNKIKSLLTELKSKKIFYKNKLAFTPYSSSCGNQICSSKTIWNKNIAYLKAKKLKTKFDKWSFKLDLHDLHEIIGINSINNIFYENSCVFRIDGIKINTLTGLDEHKKISISGENFRRKINQKLGWNKIKSNVFSIKKYKNYYLIKGSGFGHNVGFCIKEAIYLAKKGMSYIEILDYFFEGIELR